MPNAVLLLEIALVALHIGIFIAALVIIPAGRRPQTALAWLLLVYVIPYLGFVLFLLLGRTSVGEKRRTEQAQVNAEIMAVTGLPAAPSGALDDGPEAGLIRLNHALSGLPMTHGNTVELIEDYAHGIELMRQAVAEAHSHVHVQFYISAWDELTGPFFEELVRATERGVTVRFLFDHLGSRGIPVYKDMLKRLEGTKIQWARMLPVEPLRGQFRRPDLRNHRKILVVDGAVAFSGSQNLIEPSYNKPKNQRLGREWVELVAKVEGPAVRQLGVVFATDWLAETGERLIEEVLLEPPAPHTWAEGVEDVHVQVVPSGPGFTTENNLRLFTAMIYGARHRLSLTSPYFVPDDSLLYAVTTAARRGVDVELFVSATADQFMVAHAQRSYYDALLEAGVRIWLYPEPNVLHAKHFSVDDDLAVVGSSNMDMRSFSLNYEVVMMMTGRPIVDRLRVVEDHYRALSTELTLEAWRSRGLKAKWLNNLMRLTATVQ